MPEIDELIDMLRRRRGQTAPGLSLGDLNDMYIQAVHRSRWGEPGLIGSGYAAFMRKAFPVAPLFPPSETGSLPPVPFHGNTEAGTGRTPDGVDPRSSPMAGVAPGAPLLADNSAALPGRALPPNRGNGRVGPPPAVNVSPRPSNNAGYVPTAADANTLARMLFAEGSNTSDDYPALGWAIVNRVGHRAYGGTLDEVLHKKGAFQFLEEGGGPKGGSAQWRRSATPDALTCPDAESWKKAQNTANGILSGAIPDPTGGATMFFSSEIYDGRPETAPGDFGRMLKRGTVSPGKYKSRSRYKSENYFLIDNTLRPQRVGKQ